MRRWPGSATGIMAAARSGRFSTPMPSRANTGIRSRRMSISTAGFFFTANTHRGSGQQDRDEIPARADAARGLERRSRATTRFVDSGVDEDFGKPKPLYKIAKPPFYAGWATPVLHDTRAGLRINAKCQVVDMNGAGDSGPLLRRRIRGRLQHARACPRHLSGLHRRNERHRGEAEGLMSRQCSEERWSARRGSDARWTSSPKHFTSGTPRRFSPRRRSVRRVPAACREPACGRSRAPRPSRPACPSPYASRSAAASGRRCVPDL